MKQKKVAALVLSAVFLAGCARTPEQPIVREKNSSSQAYQEADETEEEMQKNTGGEENSAGQEENPLAARLGASDSCQLQNQSEDGNISVTCDAQVEIPPADHVAVIKVKQQPLDEALIDQITEGFFGDCPVYDGVKYFQTTKEEALARLETLRGYQAQGNLDPYGYIAQARNAGEEDPESFYSLQEEIDSWEEIWQNAPDSKEKIQVTPRLGYVPEGMDPAESEYFENYFSGAVEMDGEVYEYTLQSAGSDPLCVKIRRGRDGSFPNTMWTEGAYDLYAEDPNRLESFPEQKEAEKMAGITSEEAIGQADAIIERLGLGNFQARTAELELASVSEGQGTQENQVHYVDGGYRVEYTRTVDGFPITHEMNYGGGLESMESTLATWGYEKVSVIVNKEGLQEAEIRNLYQIGETQVQNVEMKDFSEIMEIFQQMLQIQSSGMENCQRDYQIRDIRLGYMRIYDPGADASSGMLVPVWDFFGYCNVKAMDNGEEVSYVNALKNSSFLTINAVDGTVIDRSLGY